MLLRLSLLLSVSLSLPSQSSPSSALQPSSWSLSSRSEDSAECRESFALVYKCKRGMHSRDAQGTSFWTEETQTTLDASHYPARPGLRGTRGDHSTQPRSAVNKRETHQRRIQSDLRSGFLSAKQRCRSLPPSLGPSVAVRAIRGGAGGQDDADRAPCSSREEEDEDSADQVSSGQASPLVLSSRRTNNERRSTAVELRADGPGVERHAVLLLTRAVPPTLSHPCFRCVALAPSITSGQFPLEHWRVLFRTTPFSHSPSPTDPLIRAALRMPRMLLGSALRVVCARGVLACVRPFVPASMCLCLCSCVCVCVCVLCVCVHTRVP